jgi:hypothetical protein
MPYLPLYISLTFGITSVITVFLFYKATNNSYKTLFVLLGWLALQAFVAITGFYTVTGSMPPRFILLPLPALLCIIALFTTPGGKRYIDSLNTQTLTILHTIRIPVELVLFWLSVHKAVPQLMTFEGRNFDIISGITAPLVWYFGYVKKQMGRNLLLLWNFICIGLLINIVVNAVLSAPFPFQQFAFDQPNVAVLYFPFIWLPCCVVPLVLLSHLVSIRQLLKQKNK